MSRPLFWSQPLRFLRWAAHDRPQYFYPTVIGAMGPVALVVVPPLRSYFGDHAAPRIPMTYPSM
jgi:hypothetical protein